MCATTGTQYDLLNQQLGAMEQYRRVLVARIRDLAREENAKIVDILWHFPDDDEDVPEESSPVLVSCWNPWKKEYSTRFSVYSNKNWAYVDDGIRIKAWAYFPMPYGAEVNIDL